MDDVVGLAAAIAVRAHAGQCDKAGRPYVEHVRRVAGYVDQRDPSAIAAALLHDTIEDADVTPGQLREAGIPAGVVEAVLLLTRRADQIPADYYVNIRGHCLAREVKLADLADNTDPERLARLPLDRQFKLRAKYAAAYLALGAPESDGARRRSGHAEA
jgi:hypothetical protein